MTRIFNIFALQHQFAQDETVFPHLGSSHLRFVQGDQLCAASCEGGLSPSRWASSVPFQMSLACSDLKLASLLTAVVSGCSWQGDAALDQIIGDIV